MTNQANPTAEATTRITNAIAFSRANNACPITLDITRDLYLAACAAPGFKFCITNKTDNCAQILGEGWELRCAFTYWL